MQPSFHKGQTFIEILVAITVIASLSALLILYTRTGELQSRLIRNADHLAINIRKAQNLALLSREFQGQIPCGYGVHFDNDASEYYIFADLPSGPDCATANSRRDTGGPTEDVELIRLEPGIQARLNGAPAVSDVVFLPPEPTTTFFPPSVSDRMDITLYITGNPSVSRTIRVTQAGQITVLP